MSESMKKRIASVLSLTATLRETMEQEALPGFQACDGRPGPVFQCEMFGTRSGPEPGAITAGSRACLASTTDTAF